ncbi:hypothetical protein IB286_03950 [Spongiibacter sp. KMU-158]|uniref:Xaa-Pro dipeptidyl-peptidase-like domain-containing protein n=1 Tax=Spongiibacter pelagi TaxID=2760804 RepID=A0A927BYZ2_9GAMM|nr:CocE/NonD family hydrolase [Spongiibacter pelagi]MBD2858150.1 hypothetical protein [Spongiibacter pelagi]
MIKRHTNKTVLSLAFGLALTACGGGSSGGGAPASNNTTLTLPPEPPAGCTENIEQRIANGQGYCYETSLISHDGTLIAMQVFVPDEAKRRELSNSAANEPGFAPLIIHSHGFGGTKAEDFAPPGTELDRQVSLDLWQSGYWVISYTQRGFGDVTGGELSSGGQIGLMAPDKEGWDFVSVVDWAICHLRENAPFEAATEEQDSDPEFDNCGQQWGRSLLAKDNHQRLQSFDDDVSLGTIGYSYGGHFQLNAQSVDPRVDAILPMGTWYDLRTSLHPNDVPKSDWIVIMTLFGSSIPEVGGGNGQPLPDVIIDANLEANGVNEEVDDLPYNKLRQVSVKNMNILAPNGAVAYCNNNNAYYALKFGDADKEFHELNATGKPRHAATVRQARADMFMIQGYGDTLFPMDEGLLNARCFEASGRDTYYLGETSGHPLPALGPTQYAGVDTSMYLDEIVHCGTDSKGDPIRYNTRILGRQWFNDKLLGKGNFAQVFPGKACITQTNEDSRLVLDTNDDFFDNGTTNTGDNAYKWSREGATFSKVSDIPFGGSDFTFADASLITGPGSLGQGAEFDPRPSFVPLTEVSKASVMAGMPTAKLQVTRTNPLSDEIFFAGIGVKRCQTVPSPNQDGSQCEDNSVELLHFQVVPIRLFATDAIGVSEASYPADDPRNFGIEAKGHLYPVRWGYNPVNPTEGTLHGVSTRLYPGDVVGLYLMPEHPVFTTIFSTLPGQVTVSGTVSLPILSNANPAPTQIPDYVISQ